MHGKFAESVTGHLRDPLLKWWQRSSRMESARKSQAGTLREQHTSAFRQAGNLGQVFVAAFATQLSKIESLRDKDSLSDLVRGLYLYGAKTVQPDALAKMIVSAS